MISQDRTKAWGFAVFADDIRFEVGGKTSLMGMYQSDMVFPDSMKFPIIIPRLIIQVMYYEIVGAIEDDISFKVTYARDMTIAEVPVLRKDLATAATSAATAARDEPDEEPERIFHIRLPIGISPWSLTEFGRLKVRAHYGNGAVLKLGSMVVKQMPDVEFQAVTGLLPSAPQR